METKQQIRKKIAGMRRECTEEQVQEWSRAVTQRLISLPAFRNARRMLVYADYNHEVCTRYLIEEAWKAGKEVAVPKVCGQEMIFYRLNDFSELSPGYFGIPEPDGGEAADWPDALMIMPGVAFDRDNHRVGYGGGFYDRFLEKHPKLEKVAAAFSFQIFSEVPYEETDIQPQIIVTEKETLYLREERNEGL